MNRQPIFLVYPKLPKAGLGNMLLVWAQSAVFANINSLPIIAPTWGQLKLGPFLRGERDKRYYGNFFCDKDCVSKFQYIAAKLKDNHVYYNPAISKIDQIG